MGVTISSKNHSIDMGYIGFKLLRQKVADLTSKEIGQHYKHLVDGLWLLGQEQKKFFSEYDTKTKELCEQNKEKKGIFNFLYASDCEAKISHQDCKSIYEVIKDHDDDIAYGYAGRKDCATFKSFKEIVKDCIDKKCYMEWS
ncbi:hypothetical protein [Pectinatus frisingensis]|uniref:hypothetical protein n=1 Tax=Pectinatus frisingensis TaxID=865 RepID=UPI0018C5E904|nr:hypothetical protein [Pectinatus frisingensis]